MGRPKGRPPKIKVTPPTTNSAHASTSRSEKRRRRKRNRIQRKSPEEIGDLDLERGGSGSDEPSEEAGQESVGEGEISAGLKTKQHQLETATAGICVNLSDLEGIIAEKESTKGKESLARTQTQYEVGETSKAVRKLNLEGEVEPAKSYARAVLGNRAAENGVKLSYDAPNRDEEGECVVFSDEDVEDEVRKWKNSLVIYVVGDDHTLGFMSTVLHKMWEPQFSVHQIERGFYIARFGSEEACNKILEGVPYNIKNRPLVIKQWEPEFDFRKEKMFTMPIWIKLPRLPLQYWGERSLSRIASLVGKPLHTDECTVNQKMLAYARILVEVDISQPLVRMARLKVHDGKVIEQAVDYEWIPKFCQKCQMVGHNCVQGIKEKKPAEPGKPAVQQWRIKEKGRFVEKSDHLDEHPGNDEKDKGKQQAEGSTQKEEINKGSQQTIVTSQNEELEGGKQTIPQEKESAIMRFVKRLDRERGKPPDDPGPYTK